MPGYESGIVWFDDNMFLGSEVSFPGMYLAVKSRHQTVEHESCGSEEDQRPIMYRKDVLGLSFHTMVLPQKRKP